MKLKLAILITFLSISVLSQTQTLNREEVIKEPLTIFLTKNDSYDEVIKSMFDRFWPLPGKQYVTSSEKSSKFKFITALSMDTKKENNLVFFLIDNKKYNSTQFYSCTFDDLKRDSKDPAGRDKSEDDYRNKLALFIMTMCRKIQLLPQIEYVYFNYPLTVITTKKKLKDYKVLIPAGMVSKIGSSSETINKYIANHELKPTSDITEDILKNETENTAQLIITQTKMFTVCSVIDLTNGDVIATSMLKHLNGVKKITPERFEKLLSSL